MSVYSPQAHCSEEPGARMMEANCKITQQKLGNVVNELENCSERFVMKGSDWAEAEKCELPCCLLIIRAEIIKV